MTTAELKAWVKDTGRAKLVAELVETGWELDSALEYVWDAENLSKEEFMAKHWK